MGLLVFILIASLALFLINGGILLGVTKLLKVGNASYKQSLIILVVSGIAGVILSIIFSLIRLGLLSNIIVGVLAFLVFHHLYKKYYQVSWKKSLGVYVLFGVVGFIFSLILVIPARLYLVSPFLASGDTMSPTYNNGDYLLINKFNKDFARGDVVVFRYEKLPGTFLIKRIVGLPLEKIEIKDGKVFANGQVLNETYYSGKTSGDISITLGQDQYFVLGDNRSKSFDSRGFGPINRSSITGKVFYDWPNPIVK